MEQDRLYKRIYKLIKSEIKDAAPLAAATYTLGFGKTGLVLPLIYRISDKISDVISGEIVCIQNLVDLGVPKSFASFICSIYKKLFFLFLFVQMTNYSYMYIFADTPTIFSFLSNYGVNLYKLGKDLSFDFSNCGIEALNEIISVSKGTGGFVNLGKEIFGDLYNLTINYIFYTLTKISIGFAANIGILLHSKSLGNYMKNLLSTMKQAPQNIHQWITEWSDWMLSSGSADVIIENKDKVIQELTNVKNIIYLNETIIQNLDDSTKKLGKDKFSKVLEQTGKTKEKSFLEMTWNEKAWYILNIKGPTDTFLPMIHENLETATSQTYDSLVEGMKNSESKVIKRFANTESISGGFCKTKIKNRIDTFDKLYKKDVKVFDQAFKVPTDYVDYLIPKYDVNLSQGKISQSIQIDPGKSYNPAPDMVITSNILTIIIVIFFFIHSILIPLSRLGKSLYRKVSQRR